MELWEMTYNQYCEYWLNTNKYKHQYKNDRQKWENKKQDLKLKWISILEERAEIGDIPEQVIRSLVNLVGKEVVLRTFRGTKGKGLQSWLQTQKNKIYREKSMI